MIVGQPAAKLFKCFEHSMHLYETPYSRQRDKDCGEVLSRRIVDERQEAWSLVPAAVDPAGVSKRVGGPYGAGKAGFARRCYANALCARR